MASHKNHDNVLFSSQFIHNFQAFFGVQKLHSVNRSNNGPWVSVKVEKGLNKKILNDGNCHTNGRNGSWNFEEEKESETLSTETNVVYYKIGSKLWYYIFLFGTQLGEEPFCALFFSFWFWNLDANIGRKLVLVWNLIMYIGQYLKDLIRWERPSVPTVVQLQTKWAKEYGMPSTHAMMGLAVPTAAFFFTMAKYQFSYSIAVGVTCLWSFLVCTSRMYLGMHSLGDVLAGLSLSALLLPPVLTFVHVADEFLLQSPVAPVVTLSLTLISITIFPCSAWSPSAITAVDVLGCYQGAQLGQWMFFRLGYLEIFYHQHLSIVIPSPSTEEVLLMMLRVIIGGFISVLVLVTVKPASHKIVNRLMQDKSESGSVNKQIYTTSRVISKLITWLIVCFSVTFISPITFKMLGCDRSSSYLEHNEILWQF